MVMYYGNDIVFTVRDFKLIYINFVADILNVRTGFYLYLLAERKKSKQFSYSFFSVPTQLFLITNNSIYEI